MRNLLPYLAPVLFFGETIAAESPIPQKQSRSSAFWTTEDGFRSTLLLRNINRRDDLLVYTTLFNSDGLPLPLSPLTIRASSTMEVDIDFITKGAGWRAASGSALLEWTHSSMDQLLVETVIENRRKSISYSVPTPEKIGTSHRLYGLYFRNSDTVELYAALHNTSVVPLVVTPSLAVAAREIDLPSVTIPPNGMRLLDLPEDLSNEARRLWSSGQAGTLLIRHDGPDQALLNHK